MARQKLRNNILEAAATVFSQKGYRTATVADILTEAGVARGTFYHYFPNKRQVFVELLREFLDNLYENTYTNLAEGEKTPESAAQKIRDGLVVFYRYFLEHKCIIEVYYREAFGTDPALYAAWDNFDHRMIDLISRALDRGVERGQFRAMDSKLVARALLMLCLQVPYRELMVRGRPDIDVESIADEMVLFAMYGIIGGRPAAPSVS